MAVKMVPPMVPPAAATGTAPMDPSHGFNRAFGGPRCQPNNPTPNKRRRTSATTSGSRSSANHLSGDQIRRLREQKKAQEEMRSHVGPAAAPPTLLSLTKNLPVLDTEIEKPIKCPILTKRDSSNAVLDETNLNGEQLPAFSIGGEYRVCLKQVIRQIPKHFFDAQINAAMEELQIHYVLCSKEELTSLKTAGVVPMAEDESALITKTDAERLVSYFKSIGEQNSIEPELVVGEEDEVLEVQHECFGKAQGKFLIHHYVAPNSKCIQCRECGKCNVRSTKATICIKPFLSSGKTMSPPDFVRHLHSKRENRTCHWGFDIDNWRSYIHLTMNADDDRHKATEKLLNDAKQKFQTLKRKQVRHIFPFLIDDGPQGQSRQQHCMSFKKGRLRQPVPISLLSQAGKQADQTSELLEPSKKFYTLQFLT